MNKLFTIIFSVFVPVIICQGQRVVFEKKLLTNHINQLNAITPLDDGGFLLVGAISPKNFDLMEMPQKESLPAMVPCVVKVDKAGNVLWKRVYTELNDLGILVGIQSINPSEFLMTGNQGGRYPMSFLLKVNSEGDFSAFSEFSFFEAPYGKIIKMKPAASGRFAITGKVSDRGDQRMFTAVTDTSGRTYWQQSYASFTGADGRAQGDDVLKVKDGYLVAGYAGKERQAHFTLFKLGTNSDSLWAKTYSPERSMAYVVKATQKDNEFLVGGRYASSNRVLKNAFLVKVNQRGDSLWTCRFGNGKGNEVVDICVNHKNEYLVLANIEKVYDSSRAKNVIGLYKFSAQGKLLNKKVIAPKTAKDYYASVILPLKNNEYIILGDYSRGMRQKTLLIKVADW